MIAKVLNSFSKEKVSYLTGIGVPSEVPARWNQIVNGTKELYPGEVVELDLRRDGRGVVTFTNIKVLSGAKERDALNSPALNPKVDDRFAPHRLRRGR